MLQYFLVPKTYDGSETSVRAATITLSSNGALYDEETIDDLHKNFTNNPVSAFFFEIVESEEPLLHLETTKTYATVSAADTEPHQSAVVVLEDKNGSLLIVDHFKYFVKTFPIGKMDDGETLKETATRELFEETGLFAVPIATGLVIRHEFTFCGKTVPVEMHIFHLKVSDFQKDNIFNAEPDKHLSLSWLTPSQLKSTFRTAVVVNEYLKANY
jgi:8-oxo-dGTP pyrophosphatase MutT (NUDIX family)